MASVAFASAEVGRIFLACVDCRRVMPHYRVYGRVVKRETEGRCACGGGTFKPTHIPEWRAALWVCLAGWLWRKTICRQPEWDPRMPVRAV